MVLNTPICEHNLIKNDPPGQDMLKAEKVRMSLKTNSNIPGVVQSCSVSIIVFQKYVEIFLPHD